MTLDVTIECRCNNVFLEQAHTYHKPPPPEVTFDLNGQKYYRKYNRCQICSHWFADHSMDLSSLYESEYTRATYGGLEGLKNKFDFVMGLDPEKSDNVSRVTFINDYCLKYFNRPKPFKVLDVGAGLGVFGSRMVKTGWNFFGIEMDEVLVKHLTNYVGLEAIRADLKKIEPSMTGLFDLVTFNKVLEHVENPVALLSTSKKFLSKNGLVYLEVPDVVAENESAEREEFTIEHHHVFSLTSVDMLARNSGMEALTIQRLTEASGKYTIRAVLGLI